MDSPRASVFPVSGFRPGSRANARLQPRFRFLVSDSGLDLLRSLLNFWFPVSVSSCALARVPGSSPYSAFRYPVFDSGLDRLRSLLNFWFPILGFWPSSRSIAQLQPRFWFQVSDSDLDLVRSLLESGFRSLASFSCDCLAQAWIPVSTFQFEIPFCIISARSSI